MAAGRPSHPPRRGGRRRRRPSGLPEPPRRGSGEGEGRGSARAGGGAARGGCGARGGGAGVGGRGAPGSRSRPLAPSRALAATPSLPLRASGRRRACADAAQPAKRPGSPPSTPARRPVHSVPFFFSRLLRGFGRMRGEKELGFYQSLKGWVGLEAGRGGQARKRKRSPRTAERPANPLVWRRRD